MPRSAWMPLLRRRRAKPASISHPSYLSRLTLLLHSRFWKIRTEDGKLKLNAGRPRRVAKGSRGDTLWRPSGVHWGCKTSTPTDPSPPTPSPRPKMVSRRSSLGDQSGIRPSTCLPSTPITPPPSCPLPMSLMGACRKAMAVGLLHQSSNPSKNTLEICGTKNYHAKIKITSNVGSLLIIPFVIDTCIHIHININKYVPQVVTFFFSHSFLVWFSNHFTIRVLIQPRHSLLPSSHHSQSHASLCLSFVCLSCVEMCLSRHFFSLSFLLLPFLSLFSSSLSPLMILTHQKYKKSSHREFVLVSLT